MTLPLNKIIETHVLDGEKGLPSLPEESVNCSITSVPYWGLRCYNCPPVVWGGDKDCRHEWGKDYKWQMSGGTEKTNVGNFKDNRIHGKAKTQFCQLCGAWRGELGLEPTPELYIEHLMMVFDEVKRVLRKDGILFVNINDTYASSMAGKGSLEALQRMLPRRNLNGIETSGQMDTSKCGITAKSLCAIPERFVLAMAEHGWIRRCTIIWTKGLSFCETYSGSCMPDSCKDRPNKNGFEYVYMFTKSKKYWYEQQYEEAQELNAERPRMGQGNQTIYKQKRKDVKPVGIIGEHSKRGQTPGPLSSPLGRTIRNVWAINPEPFPEAHFATFPRKLIEPLIKMGCPEFVCKKCGRARKKIYSKPKPPKEVFTNTRRNEYMNFDFGSGQKFQDWRNENPPIEIGLTDCGCNAGWVPGVALDPFTGSGTTCLVAYELRRDYLGMDLQPDYVKMGNKRLAEAKGNYSLLERQ